jgi:predicted lipoprotein with Yx(FWY)xxD motif
MISRRVMGQLAGLTGALVLAGCAGWPGGPSSDTTRPRSDIPGGPAVRISQGTLVDARGMTLYTFDRDVRGSGKSACNGQCAANWPPLPAAAGIPPGDFSIVSRDDRSLQLAYKGKPLYRWAKDSRPGERSGDGVNGVWRVARP